MMIWAPITAAAIFVVSLLIVVAEAVRHSRDQRCVWRAISALPRNYGCVCETVATLRESRLVMGDKLAQVAVAAA